MEITKLKKRNFHSRERSKKRNALEAKTSIFVGFILVLSFCTIQKNVILKLLSNEA
jgi:hypothetical protein